MIVHRLLHHPLRVLPISAVTLGMLAACTSVPRTVAFPSGSDSRPGLSPTQKPGVSAPVSPETFQPPENSPEASTGAARLVIHWPGRRIQWLPSDLARVECTVRSSGSFVASGSAVLMAPGGGSAPGTYTVSFSRLPVRELDFDVEAFSEGSLAGTIEAAPSATGSSRVQMLPNVSTPLEVVLETTRLPAITSVSPLFAFVGDRILIEGSNLVENRVSSLGSLVPREPYTVRIGDFIMDSFNASPSFDVLNPGRLSVRIDTGCTGGAIQFTSRGKTAVADGEPLTVLKSLRMATASLPPAYLVAESVTQYPLQYEAFDSGDLLVPDGKIPPGTFTWGIVQEITDATQSSGGISSADRIVQLTGSGTLQAGKKYGVAVFGLYSGGGSVLRATSSVRVGP